MIRWVSLIFAFAHIATGFGQLSRTGAIFFADFRKSSDVVQLRNGGNWDTNAAALVFDAAMQYAELTDRLRSMT